MKTLNWRKLLTFAAVMALAGCGLGSEVNDAEDAADTSSSTSSESALLSAAGEDSTATPASMTDDQLAEGAKARFGGKFNSGCVTSTRNLNVVTYVLLNCTGPYGLVKVSGTMVVTYTRQVDGSIKADATGTGLKVNDGTLDLTATAIYSKDAAGLEHVVVNTHGVGTGARGHTGDRVGNYTVTRDQTAGCVSLEGKWTTQWDGSRATTSTQVTGLKKCSGACPAAGGVVKHTGILGKVLTLTFDGTSVAAWSSTNGKSGTVNLQCK